MNNSEKKQSEIEDSNKKTTEIAEKTREINGKKLTYKSKEVASILNTTPEMLRHYCNDFEEFLNLNHEPGKHRIFTEENISMLKYIIYLCKDRNFSTKQAKEYLSTPEGQMFSPVKSEEDHLKAMVDLISKSLLPSITEIINTAIDSKFETILSRQEIGIAEVKLSQIDLNSKVTDLIQSSKINTELLELNVQSSELIGSISKETSNKVDEMIAKYRENWAKKDAEEQLEKEKEKETENNSKHFSFLKFFSKS